MENSYITDPKSDKDTNFVNLPIYLKDPSKAKVDFVTKANLSLCWPCVLIVLYDAIVRLMFFSTNQLFF